MNPRPNLKDEYKRSKTLIVKLTEKEEKQVAALAEMYRCRDKSDFVRKAIFGEIHVDRNKTL